MKEESITIQGAVGKLKGIVTTPPHCNSYCYYISRTNTQ